MIENRKLFFFSNQNSPIFDLINGIFWWKIESMRLFSRGEPISHLKCLIYLSRRFLVFIEYFSDKDSVKSIFVTKPLTCNDLWINMLNHTRNIYAKFVIESANPKLNWKSIFVMFMTKLSLNAKTALENSILKTTC